MGKIVIYRSARRHFILDQEIRGVVSYPLVRYHSASRLMGHTQVVVFIGGSAVGPWIEVVGEERAGELHVFHAMMLTRRTALEVEAATGRSVSLVRQLVSQRSRYPGERT